MDILGQFGSGVWTFVVFVIALSVIVAIHEYGHYIVGKWTGIKADVFSLGFGPVLASRVGKDGTVWQVAALPFGGYVKFVGDANAASGKDEEAMAAVEDDPAALRHTMHGAPLWARSLTVAAGPVFNFALSIIVFFCLAMFAGVSKDPLTVGEMRPLPQPGLELQQGDIITSVAGLEVPSVEDGPGYAAFLKAVPVQPTLDFGVERAGDALTVTGPYLQPTLVGQVVPRSAAYEAGLLPGDVITAIDGTPVFAFSQLQEAVTLAEDTPLQLDVWRDGVVSQFTMTPKASDEPQDDGTFTRHMRIGIISGMAFEPATTTPNVGEAISGSVASTWRIVNSSINGLGQMIAGSLSTCNLSGPLGIAQTSGAMARQGLETYIYFIAVISTAVGLLNLFPIPALDGGHLVFYAYEAVRGKPPSDGAQRLLMTMGLAMVLCLMVFALGNDLFCP